MRNVCVSCLVIAVCCFADAVQTDWSAGETSGIVDFWGSGFSSSGTVSHLAVPGQICLGSVPLTSCVETVVDDDLSLAGMASCDIDGDGLIDLAGASLVDGHVWWFQNQAGGGWISHSLPGSFEGALGCSFFDMDSDGYMDIVGSTCEPDRIVVWMNDSGNCDFSEPVIVAESFPGVHCAVGCFADDDQLPDLLAAGNECNEIAVWYGLGGNQWEKVVIDPSFDGTQSVSPGDFDGDGDTDAVAASLTLGQFAWYENPGNREDPWAKHLVAGNMPGAHHTVAVDMNADGFIDVLGASFSNAKITWWESDGADPPEWTAHTVAPSLTGALTAIPGDFDGDNDLDVAGASWSLDRILWYENTDGEGENWQVRAVKTGFNGAWPVTAGDFDRNGSLDIAAGADVLTGQGPSHGPSVFRVCDFLGSGWLESSVLDTGESPQWSSFHFQGEVPSGCSLSFFWRSSDDAGDLGEWNGPFTSWAELSGAIHRYVQYRVEMEGPGGSLSPVLQEIELFWDPNGTGGQPETGGIFIPVSSPCRSEPVISVLPSEVDLTLSIMDLSGRLAFSYSGICTGEIHCPAGLSTGLYIIRAISGGLTQVQKICLVK